MDGISCRVNRGEWPDDLSLWSSDRLTTTPDCDFAAESSLQSAPTHRRAGAATSCHFDFRPYQDLGSAASAFRDGPWVVVSSDVVRLFLLAFAA